MMAHDIGTEPLTEKELEVVLDYLSKDSGIPDWPIMQTPLGRVDGPIFKRLLVTISAARGTIEAVREFVSGVDSSSEGAEGVALEVLAILKGESDAK